MKNFKLLFNKYNKIIRYIFSGIIASATNFIILYLLVQGLKVWYLSAAAISFCCGIIASYCLHKFFTFKNHSTHRMVMQFSRFFIYNMFMLGINTFLMYILVSILNFWYILAQVFVTIFIAFINYMFFNKIIFRD